MIIQFSDLISSKNRKKEVNITYELAPLYFDGENIEAVEALKVVGNVISVGDVLTLKASIETKLKMHCSRCLETFIYPIDIDIEERFTNNKELQEDEEIIFVDSDSFDIANIVENVIISTLPIKRLCTDNCKGLCYQCGKNLNEGACHCETNDVDLRLAKLQELFGNKEV
ncbi:YceD family protein [Clostridium nigeriense]|uniref:YceD family protein n=1 Tax=Clostridium nigeriense TaxID=1805470 RepID=UPI003D3574B2